MLYNLISKVEVKLADLRAAKRLRRREHRHWRKIEKIAEIKNLLEDEKAEKAQLAEESTHAAKIRAAEAREAKQASKNVATPSARLAAIVIPAMAANSISVVNGKAVLSREEQTIQDKYCNMIKDARNSGDLELRDHLVAQMRMRNAPLREVNKRLAMEKQAARLAQYESGKRINPIVFRNFPPITREDISIMPGGKVIISNAEQRRQDLISQYIFELKQSGDTKKLAEFVEQVQLRNKPLRAARQRGVKIREEIRIGVRKPHFVTPPSRAKMPCSVL